MDAAPSTSTSSNGPQPSSTGPAAEGADTAKMNPENRLILIIIASVIGGVLLLGGLLSLYRRLRDRRRARSHLPTHIPPTRTITTTQTPLIPGIACQRLHTNMTGASTDSISTHHTRTTGTGEGGGYGEGTSTGRDTPDLIAPTPHTPQIVVSPPASDSPHDTSLATMMAGMQPSARGSDETEKRLAEMRQKYGAYLEKQGQRVRAGSVSVSASRSLADDLGMRIGGDSQQCVDVGEGPPHEVAAEKDSAAGDEKDARARWGGVSVPQLAPVQPERPSKDRGLNLGKLPGYEMRQTVNTGR